MRLLPKKTLSRWALVAAGLALVGVGSLSWYRHALPLPPPKTPVQFEVHTTKKRIGNGDYQGAMLADFDHDGDLDLALPEYSDAGKELPDGSVDIQLNDGHGNFGGGSSVEVGPGPVNLVAADIDGDGDLDVLTDNSVSRLLNDGHGHFQRLPDLPAGSLPNNIVAGDLDGDHDPDFVLADGNIRSLLVGLNDGRGRFRVQERRLPVKGFPEQAALTDTDGDGDLDVLLALSCSGNCPLPAAVLVLANDGHGNFQLTTHLPLGYVGGVRDMAVGNLNGDGRPDFLALSDEAVSTVHIGLNAGHNTFALSAPATRMPGLLPAGSSPFWHVALTDVDHDGDLDAVLPGVYLDSVWVQLNDGHGRLTATHAFAPGGRWVGKPASGDVDHDGDQDLIFPCFGGRVVHFNQAVPAPPKPRP